MTYGLVDVGYSLPEGQVVILIFFATWCWTSDRVVHIWALVKVIICSWKILLAA